MPTVKRSVEINRPPEIIAQALLEPGNAVHWTKGLDRFEIVAGKPGLVGSHARLHYIEDGREYIMDDVLEFVDPGRRYISTVSGGGIKARVETTLEPIPVGTRMRIKWSGSGTSLPLKLILPFMRRAIARQTDGDLNAFKRLIERYGPIFPADATAADSA